MQLEGKRALITGAGSGIGQRLAIEAAERGVKLIITGRRKEALDNTLSKLPAKAHYAFASDVTKPEDRTALMEAVRRHWGGLDILINNAGVVPVGPLAQSTDEELEAAVATNLVAPISLVRQALPLLKRGESSRVVNIGSVLGDIPYPLMAIYSATKSGLRGFSIALRRELEPLGIGVTYAAPRTTRTAAASALGPLVQAFGLKFDKPEAVAKLIWDAVERDAKSVYPAGPEKMFVLVQRLFPHLVDRSVAEQLAKVGAA
ncbi:MAG TPA: SDR family NAD(P)-dependent oxidoreductase [Geobacterales bacterium]|nr:SDR family NAD(P)-dependent oxidoreductase [Geobacterales bacterium]